MLTPPSIKANSFLQELGMYRGAYLINVYKTAIELDNELSEFYSEDIEGIYIQGFTEPVITEEEPAYYLNTDEKVTTIEQITKSRTPIYFPRQKLCLPPSVMRHMVFSDKPGKAYKSFMLIRDYVTKHLLDRNPYSYLSTQNQLFCDGSGSSYLYAHYLFTKRGTEVIENGEVDIELILAPIIEEVDKLTLDRTTYEWKVSVKRPNLELKYIADVRALAWMKEQDEKELE